MKQLILIITFLCSFTLLSQPLSTWQRLYDGPEHYQDYGYSITLADSGNFFVTGSSKFWSAPPYYRFFILKIKPNSDTIWTRILSNNEAFCSTLSSDNGLVVSGDAGIIRTLKFDRNGVLIWQKSYNHYGITYSIQKAPGGFVLCGVNQDEYWDKGFVLRINNAGDTIWHATINSFIRLFSIDNSVDGGFVSAGDNIVVKLDSSGNIIWQKIYDNLACVDIRASKKFKNKYVIGGVGIDSNNHNINGPCIIFLNNNGDLISRKLYPSYKSERFSCMKILDDKFILSSYHQNNGNDTCYNRVIVTDTNGTVLRQKYFYYSGLVDIQSVEADMNNYYFVGTADYSSPISGSDVYVLKTDSVLNYTPGYINVQQTSENIPKEYYFYQNYPNPFNPQTTIKYDIPKEGFVSIEVYDILGKEVKTLVNEYKKAGSYTVEFDGTNLASGLYFYKISIGSYVETKKMLILK